MISTHILSDATEGLTTALECIPNCLLAIAMSDSDVGRVDSMMIERGQGEGIENGRGPRISRVGSYTMALRNADLDSEYYPVPPQQFDSNS